MTPHASAKIDDRLERVESPSPQYERKSGGDRDADGEDDDRTHRAQDIIG